jgi:hypothetical protein
VIKKEATNSFFTLIHIKKLVDIGLAPQSPYTYNAHSDDTGNELLQGDDVEDNDKELEEPLEQEEQSDEEQASVDEEQDQARPGGEEDTDEDTETEDDDRNPSSTKQAAAVNMTQSSMELAHSIASTSVNMTQFTSELAQSIAPTSAIMTQSTMELAQLITPTSGNMTQSASKLAQSEDMNDDDLKPAAKPAANVDNELCQSTIALSLSQSGTLDPVNVDQTAFDQARIADAILNELALTHQVRNINVPIFSVHYLCI